MIRYCLADAIVDASGKQYNNTRHKTSPSITTTTTTTPTKSNTNALTPTRRRPLRPVDGNVMMRALPKSPLTAKSGNATMPPYDKQNGPPRPRMPVAGKPTSGSPLTPRVVGAAPSTPSARWQDSNTPSASKEDLSTPVSTFLSINVTPRSGSRKSRVDSANTTPSGTPTGTPAPASDPLRIYEPPSHASGLGIGGAERDILKRPTVSFSPSVSENAVSRGMGHSNSEDTSKFFFASDAKSVQGSKPTLPPKASNFFYANGDSIPAPQSSSTSAVGSSIGDDRGQPKFFHANGSPDLQGSPHLPPPRPGSTVSTTSRMASPRIAGSGALSPPQRPSSPTKLSQQTSTSVHRGPLSVPSPPLPRPQALGRGQSANAIVAPAKTGTESPERSFSHGRSSSLSSVDSKAASRRVSGSSSFGDSTTTPTSPLNNLVPNLARLSSSEDIPEEDEPVAETIPSMPQSPTKAGHSLERMNELAANARRERKVLDLEITNSSLAAINRTLEREMRKQTAELRRYRRLSRSGRLSIATSASIRTSTGLSTIDGDEDESTAQLSDLGDEGSEEVSDFDSSEDSIDDRSLDPEALAASDLRHRKRDEKRLQLDLSKHQQLLIDSQKLNESLKRCLGWTEGLISEGKKALEYSVRVSDVELGGRVLVVDDAEETEGTRRGGALLPNAIAEDTASWTGENPEAEDAIELDMTAQRELPP